MKKNAALLFPILLLNSTERERVELAVLTEKSTVTITRDQRAQVLPELVGLVLEKAGLELADIKSLAVCTEPGSLTGTRIGVTVANTLSWLSQLPIYELSEPSLAAAIKELQTKKTAPQKVAAVHNEVVY